MPSGAGWKESPHPFCLSAAVRSCTRPAWAYCASTPPPQLWNRSGGLPDCMEVASLSLKAWFSRMVISIETLGWSLTYWFARFCQLVRASLAVLICHHSMRVAPVPRVTGPGVSVGTTVGAGVLVPAAATGAVVAVAAAAGAVVSVAAAGAVVSVAAAGAAVVAVGAGALGIAVAVGLSVPHAVSSINMHTSSSGPTRHREFIGFLLCTNGLKY